MAKKSKKSVRFSEAKEAKLRSSTYKFLFLSGLVLLLLFFLFKQKPGLKPTVLNDQLQSSVQLTKPDGQLNGFGTALKSYDGKTFELNVTTFLNEPSKGKAYFVYLKGASGDVRDIFAGRLTKSGDVYSLNYMSGDDLYSYRELIVIEADDKSKDAPTGPTILKGSFPN